MTENDNEEAASKIEFMMNVRGATIFCAMGVDENGGVLMVALEHRLIPADVMAAINGAVIKIMEEEKQKRN